MDDIRYIYIYIYRSITCITLRNHWSVGRPQTCPFPFPRFSQAPTGGYPSQLPSRKSSSRSSSRNSDVATQNYNNITTHDREQCKPDNHNTGSSGSSGSNNNLHIEGPLCNPSNSSSSTTHRLQFIVHQVRSFVTLTRRIALIIIIIIYNNYKLVNYDTDYIMSHSDFIFNNNNNASY